MSWGYQDYWHAYIRDGVRCLHLVSLVGRFEAAVVAEIIGLPWHHGVAWGDHSPESLKVITLMLAVVSEPRDITGAQVQNLHRATLPDMRADWWHIPVRDVAIWHGLSMLAEVGESIAYGRNFR